MRTRSHASSSFEAQHRRRRLSTWLWRAVSALLLLVAGLAGCMSIVVTNLHEQVVGAEYGQPAEATTAAWVAGAALLLALLVVLGRSRD